MKNKKNSEINREALINNKFKIESYVDDDPSKSDMEKPLGHGAYSIDTALNVLRDLEGLDTSKGWCRNLTVVDGLNCLGKIDRQEIFELSTLIHRLKKTSRMSILVYEPMEREEISVEYLVDMTIDLRGEVEAGRINYFFHSMSITKSRYQATALGWHKFKIRKYGIEVYPSIHFHVHRKDYMDHQFEDSQNPMYERRQKEGKPIAISGFKFSRKEKKEIEITNEAIITRILRNIKRGSTTVLFGPRRTYKSQLTMDFLRAGSKRGKHCLLLSVMDNQDTILQEAVCQRPSCKKYKTEGGCRTCFKKIFLFFLRPGYISPEEFFHFLKKRLEYAKEKKQNIRRLIFWDLTQLEYRFPLLSGDPMFLPALMDFLKQYNDEPPIFTEKEFRGGEITKEKLYAAIIKDKYDDLPSMRKPECSIEWLNKVLEEPELYNSIVDIKPNEFDRLSENVKELVIKTKQSRARNHKYTLQRA